MDACGNEESLVMRSKLVKPMETINYKKEAAYNPNKAINKGAWTTKEDEKLAEVIAVHGPKRWKTIASKAGLNRCGKSCRLRWLNYLRPNIKRGNISDQEEDLILRLHKLLGNRWSLIAGRLPGRTDNEIKNYWNSHLSKKINSKKKPDPVPLKRSPRPGKALQTKGSIADTNRVEAMATKHQSTSAATTTSEGDGVSSPRLSNPSFSGNAAANDDFFDFSNESTLNMEWVSRFLEFDQNHHQS